MANIKNFGLVGVGSNVQFGKGGAKLTQTGGVFSVRDAADSAFARIQIATPTSANDASTKDYVDTATSTLDGIITSLQGEVDATQTGAGLGTDGAYTASESANYIDTATSLFNADTLLDTALQAVSDRVTTLEGNDTAGLQTEIDAIETAVGLETDGTLASFTGTDYLGSATTIVDALTALDTAVSGNAADILSEASDRADADTTLQGNIDTLDGEVIKKDGSVAFTGDQDMGGFKLTGLAAPTNDADASTKLYVDTAINGLGNAFNYVSNLAGGVDEENAFDLDGLSAGGKDAGDYYKVSTSGYFKYVNGSEETVSIYANANDGLVKNSGDGWDVIDNTNSVVLGTTDYVSVTGSSDTGYTVDIDAAFKARVVALEEDSSATGLQTEIDAIETAVGLETDGTLASFTGTDYLGSATTIVDALTALDSAVSGNAADILSESSDRADADTALGGRIDDLNTALGVSGDDYTTISGSNYLDSTTSFRAADLALDTQIKAVVDSLDGLSSDEIVSADTLTSVKAADGAIEFYGDVDGTKTKVGDIVTSDTQDSNFQIDLGTAGEVRVEAISGTADDVDIRLVPQGAGQVIIGDAGAGFIQAEDGYDLTLAGGDNAAGDAGNIILRGGNGSGTDGVVEIQDADSQAVMTFLGSASATGYVTATNGTTSVTLGAAGTETDINLTLAPKGDGVVDVSDTRVVNVAAPTSGGDATNKTYVDDAVSSAVSASVSGSVKTRVVDLVAGSSVNLGATVTGTVLRVKVIVTTAFDGDVTVGSAATTDELASASDVDEATTGIYVVDAAQDYTATQLVADASTATTGAGKVIVEYLAG